MHWLYGKFRAYCEGVGIQLLKDDFKFIEKMLIELPTDSHRLIMKSYCDEWCKGMDECQNASLKSNMGRRRANNYLLTQVDKLKER